MVNVSGGFAYIDMSGYGEFTLDTPKEVTFSSDMVERLTQTKKPIVICGLKYDETTIAPFIPCCAYYPETSIVAASCYITKNLYLVFNLDDSTIELQDNES